MADKKPVIQRALLVVLILASVVMFLGLDHLWLLITGTVIVTVTHLSIILMR